MVRCSIKDAKKSKSKCNKVNLEARQNYKSNRGIPGWLLISPFYTKRRYLYRITGMMICKYAVKRRCSIIVNCTGTFSDKYKVFHRWWRARRNQVNVLDLFTILFKNKDFYDCYTAIVFIKTDRYYFSLWWMQQKKLSYFN